MIEKTRNNRGYLLAGGVKGVRLRKLTGGIWYGNPIYYFFSEIQQSYDLKYLGRFFVFW